MNELVKDNLLDKFHQAGLKIFGLDNIKKDEEDETNPEESNPEEIKGTDIKIYPHYNNNFGFFTACIDDIKFIILKGQYSDNIRYISGKPSFNNAEYNILIDALFKAERVAGNPVKMTVFLTDDECFIKEAELVEEYNKYDMRDYTIPRPLATSEYAESKSRIYDEEVILSSGYFGSFFPQVSSYFTTSIFNDLLDILNPLFVSCNLKTLSPSVVPVDGRIYINMTAFEKMMHTIGLNKSLYRRVFSPNLFLKMGISKLDKLNRSFFPVTYDEIKEVVDSLKVTASRINLQNITEKSFYDYPVQFAIVYEYITIEFMNNLSILLSKFKNISLILNAIYKTRENSIFYSEEEMMLPDFLDFSSDYESVKFNVEKKVENIKIHLKSLPFFSRKSKIKKAVKNMHKLLDLRDELYIAASAFIINSNKALLKTGELGVSKGKLNHKSEIFSLDHDEIRRLTFDTLFGETKELTAFRKWRNKRYAVQLMPPEIYAYDLSDTAHIAEDMILRYKDTEAFAVYGLNRINCKGKVETDLTLDDYQDKIIAAYNLPITKLNNYKNAKGLVLENVSPLSYACEYAILNNIPLWTGIRFAPLFLKNIEIEKNTLFQVEDSNE
ncbi:MAG TPA: hypothetical protein H9804_09265 [Candidatus Mucispirillum faecigallinarum]|uniref:Uncharacterized protein n=1 Tax=Candidatus Mucispirillum faecigallinarum TaxID=2838699 RepID=A0A9D2KCH0_9BACT|nr:hypothetical protein [Candidatus Mucispirillum faecigallinarum]